MITRQMKVFFNRVKYQFAYDVPQFAVLASVSSDQNEVALGFKQRPDEIDVAIEYVHARVGQNQGVKPVLFDSLELFLIGETRIFFGCFHHVDLQVLISHSARPLYLDEQLYIATREDKGDREGVLGHWPGY